MEVLLFFHLAASLLYFLLADHHLGRLPAICETTLVAVIPGFGLVIMVIYHTICRLWHLDEREPPKDEEDKPDVFTGHMDYDENIVPLNDTFLMDDAKKKREFFTTAIKQNVVTNRSILRMAMGDSDRETAYYAVSLMTTKLEALDNRLFAAEDEVRRLDELPNWDTAGKADILNRYIDILKEYLSYGDFIDNVTYAQKRRDYQQALDRLTKFRPEEKSYYEDEIGLLLAMQDFDKATDVCETFQARFPLEERTYLAFIKLYQAQGEPVKLREKIKELKACPVALSVEAMRVIRFWDGK